MLRTVSREAREAIAHADVVIAKGQANYETLYGCGYNIFFIFMCKCMLFMDRFKVPQFTGILAYEDPEILFNVYADEALLKRYRFRQILPEEGVQAGEMDRICRSGRGDGQNLFSAGRGQADGHHVQIRRENA